MYSHCFNGEMLRIMSGEQDHCLELISKLSYSHSENEYKVLCLSFGFNDLKQAAEADNTIVDDDSL